MIHQTASIFQKEYDGVIFKILRLKHMYFILKILMTVSESNHNFISMSSQLRLVIISSFVMNYLFQKYIRKASCFGIWMTEKYHWNYL